MITFSKTEQLTLDNGHDVTIRLRGIPDAGALDKLNPAIASLASEVSIINTQLRAAEKRPK